MKWYYLIVGVLGVALTLWAEAHYDFNWESACGFGFVAGTLTSAGFTGRKR